MPEQNQTAAPYRDQRKHECERDPRQHDHHPLLAGLAIDRHRSPRLRNAQCAVRRMPPVGWRAVNVSMVPDLVFCGAVCASAQQAVVNWRSNVFRSLIRCIGAGSHDGTYARQAAR